MTHPQETDESIRQKNVPFVWLPLTIASGAAVTPEVDLGHYTLCGIHMPAAWTAANLTFQARGAPELTMANLYDRFGTEYTVVAAAARFIVLDPSDFAGVRHLIVRSGTSGTPVNQGADRVIRLMVKAL